MSGHVLAFSDPIAGVPIEDEDFPTHRARRVTDRGAFMTTTHHKRAEDTLDYTIDLLGFLEPGEEIVSCTAQVAPADLQIPLLQFCTTGVMVWLSGGADDTRHEVHCTVQTSQGRVKLFRFVCITRGVAATVEITLIISIDSITITIDPLDPGGGGQPVEEPIAAISPLSLAFASTQVGQTRDLVVTIVNSGNAPLIITGATATGDFTVTGSALA